MFLQYEIKKMCNMCYILFVSQYIFCHANRKT